MKIPLKRLLSIAAMTAAIAATSEPVFARGGGANIMNSPGYQRRLQESRQQPAQADLQNAAYRLRSRHRRRH
jgi:hypothetical protein